MAETGTHSLDGTERLYGWRVENPVYDWDMRAVPGVKGNIKIDAAIFKNNYPFGPYWMNAFEIDLPDMRLTRHDGAKNMYSVREGKKRLEKVDQ